MGSIAEDQMQIQSTVLDIFRGADNRDWATCRSAFDEQVEIDYGQPERVAADQLMQRWQAVFAPLDATQHLIGNLVVLLDGATARVRSEFIATHVKRGIAEGDTWTLGGFYEHSLRHVNGRWRVTEMRMQRRWSSGNEKLPEHAARKGSVSE